MTNPNHHFHSKKHKTIIVTTISFLVLISTSTIVQSVNEPFANNAGILTDNGYENINVSQAWDLLSTTSNGIQIPIDVRYDNEWIEQKIDTPSPEYPRHHCLCAWDNESVVQSFINEYEGETLIVYCKGGFRSRTASEILVDHNFQGTIYNMLGGIDEWNASGFPTKGNEAPNKPVINGPTWLLKNRENTFTISATDPDLDMIYYYINFSDGSQTQYLGPYPSGQEISINHSWEESGDYFIQVQATDIYQKDGEFNFHQLKIGLMKHRLSFFRDFILEILGFTTFTNT